VFLTVAIASSTVKQMITVKPVPREHLLDSKT
jgi:hypothetical protein